MSSFIVENKTINRIVNFCFWEHDEILKHEIDRELKEIGITIKGFYNDKDTDNALRLFGEELLKLNLLGFYTRYKENDNLSEEIKKDINDAIKEYQYEDTPSQELQHEQVLKSIHCFLYQCSEGETDKLPLYKCIENIGKHLSDTIINKLPAYNKAVWG